MLICPGSWTIIEITTVGLLKVDEPAWVKCPKCDVKRKIGVRKGRERATYPMHRPMILMPTAGAPA